MIKLMIVVGFAIALTTPADAMTFPPIYHPNSLITQAAYGCGPGRTRVGGVCVARTTRRHIRRQVRRCLRWHAGVCARWHYY